MSKSAKKKSKSRESKSSILPPRATPNKRRKVTIFVILAVLVLAILVWITILLTGLFVVLPEAQQDLRDDFRRSAVLRVISQLQRFQDTGNMNIHDHQFSTRAGSDTAPDDVFFLDASPLSRSAGGFRSPGYLLPNWGFITDSTGQAASIDTMAYSGLDFRCYEGDFITATPGEQPFMRSVAIRVQLDSGDFYCQDVALFYREL